MGAMLGVLALAFTVGETLLTPTRLLRPTHGLHVLGILTTLCGWALVRGAPRSRRFVLFVEAAATVSCATCFDLMMTQFPLFARWDLLAALSTTQIVVTRAVFVPSSTRRTAIITSLSCSPLALIALAQHHAHVAAGTTGRTLTPLDLTVSTAMWSALAVVLAAATSSVIYGLRRDVRDAQELGQYTLLGKIGEGGMGQVFRARHAMLRRPTAVKLLHSSTAEDLARFEREVQLTAQLTHPNTVTVFDYGRTPDGVFYYAMELLDGMDLQTFVERHGPMPPARVIHVLTQVADALSEAHGVGLIHRDIKPANVFLCTRGTTHDVVKVLDFGLVKRVERAAGDPNVSSGGLTVGTPLYMAPETLRDPDGGDGRTDLYALGAVGYFLVTGTPVFSGSLVSILADHLHTQPEPPSVRLGTPIAKDLEEILLACLAKIPEDRPADAPTLRDRLRACDDAEGWTESDASSWWMSSAAARERRAHDEATSGVQALPVSLSTRTIAVDLQQRGARRT
jgi:serine/threonine-protein kinase